MSANQYLNPFEQDYPEHYKTITEDYSNIDGNCCTFNSTGTYLAIGCIDGSIVIFDILTTKPARQYHVHKGAITSINWLSKKFYVEKENEKIYNDGGFLLTSSIDSSIVISDGSKSEILLSISLSIPIFNVDSCKKEPNILIVSYCETKNDNEDNDNLIIHWPILINVYKSNEIIKEINCLEIAKSQNFMIQPVLKQRFDSLYTKKQTKHPGVVGKFTKNSKYILIGGIGCSVFVLSYDNYKLLHICTPPTLRGLAPTSWVRGLVLSKNGKYLLIHSIGKMFCLFTIDNTNETKLLSYQRDFQDTVNNTKWLKCYFSGDSEFVLASASNRDIHKIYIWNILGQLVKILEGQNCRGILRDSIWHPIRPIIVSIDANGSIYLWSKKYSENWSAFAPNFTVIEENITYIEREDEFDQNLIIDELNSTKKKDENSNEYIDILTMDDFQYDTSDNESNRENNDNKRKDNIKNFNNKRYKTPFYFYVIPDKLKEIRNNNTQ